MLTANEQVTPAKNSQAEVAPLNGVESEIVGLFVQIARVIGLPPSVGEIYGLLFITARPMAMDDLIKRLGISKGSASQGLKFLRGAGAIQMVYVPNDRRMQFEAVAELRNLVVRFLRDQVVPNLDANLGRLDRISGMVKALPPAERARVAPRVMMLQSWQKKARRFLPMVVKLLGR
jgi:DNA-binding transcriptional regulator GbsR (MarR family)